MSLVSRVVGTEDSTPLLFSVALAQDSYLQLDDVVVTARTVPGVGEVRTSGVVTEVRARHEGANFGSDVFLIADGVLPAQVQEVAEVTTTRVEPECYVPPRPGEWARRATGEERAQALYFDRMEQKVPVGLGRDGDPIYVNLEFLDGTRGGHVSISGISGVATKTSFALFLLNSIFRSGALGRRAINAKALVFSVKGEDLLFLDHANTRLDDDLRGDYARLGLPAEPFASVGFFAPPTPDDLSGRPYVTGRTSGVAAFWWTLAQFCADELLPYVFADAEDERNQYTTVIHQVANRLRRDSTATSDGGAVAIGGQLLRTYDDLVEFVFERLTDEDARRDWAGPVIGTGTINAFLRRLRSSLKPLRTIVRSDLTDTASRRVSTDNQQVTVVDLHNLPERAQRFVVGVVLAAETARKEAAGPGGLLFTMIDELNKYAPREGTSPIKEVLLDIAERGRSLGIILIGAQQTASEVDWYVGQTLKGHSRLDEQEDVLREIVRVAREQEVDAILVAGDLYDSAAPSASAQKLVVRTLMALASAGAQVVVIAGNHDHATTFEAYRPFAGAAGITLVGSVRSAEQGGVVEFTACTGEPVTVAVLPFVSSRYAVRAAVLVANTPGELVNVVMPIGGGRGSQGWCSPARAWPRRRPGLLVSMSW